jgi:hypothetical protein
MKVSTLFISEVYLENLIQQLEKLEPPVRIELTTFRLQGGCSTTELGRRERELCQQKLVSMSGRFAS